MNDLDVFLFFSLALISTAAALSVILVRRLVYAVLLLVVMMAALSALYVQLGAHFLAVIQILIYAGAILVLFLLAVMLLGPEASEAGRRPGWNRFFSIFTVSIFAAELILILLHSGKNGEFPLSASSGTVEAIGTLLFKNYLLPFELVSVVLLVGIVGVVSLNQKEPSENKP